MEEKNSRSAKSGKRQKAESISAEKVARAEKLNAKLKELVEMAKKKIFLLQEKAADFWH